MLPPPARRYLLTGLQATPIVVEGLINDAPEARLDHRPDPERFTVREVIAHLADWDPIWLERIRRMVGEDNPFLPAVDEGQLAIDHDYGHSDPGIQLARFRSGRQELVGFLERLPDEAWDRPGQREFGSVSVASLAVMALGHDGYHARQVVEWLTGRGAAEPA